METLSQNYPIENYKAECESLDGVRYTVEIRHPLAKGKPFKSILLAEDGIHMQRKGATDEPFSIVETQVIIKAVSLTDRQYYSLYSHKDEEPVTVTIRKGSALYWCGRLLPEQFYEPFSYTDRYMTELTFSDFACLEQMPYNGKTNLGELVRSAWRYAFQYHSPTPFLTGLGDDFATRYPTFTPTLDELEIKRVYYGSRKSAYMYDIMKEVLKSFCLRLEQREGRIYLYDLYNIQRIESRLLSPVGVDSQLESLPLQDAVELKIDGGQELPFSDEPRDLVASTGMQQATVYRTDTEGLEVSHTLKTSPHGLMKYYRVEPDTAGKYDYGVMVVSEPSHGYEPKFFTDMPDGGVSAIVTGHTSAAPEGNPNFDKRVLESCDKFFSVARWCYENGGKRAWLHPPAYDFVSEFYNSAEGNTLWAKLDMELLLARAYNFVAPSINGKRFKRLSPSVSPDFIGRPSAYEKSGIRGMYVAADITAEDADGNRVGRLWNAFVDPTLGKEIDGTTNIDLKRALADYFFTENTGETTTVSGKGDMRWVSSTGEGGGIIQSTPQWRHDGGDARYCTFLRVGSGHEELKDDEWHKLKSWGMWGKDGFVFPLLSHTKRVRIRVKIYPYIVVSYRAKDDKAKVKHGYKIEIPKSKAEWEAMFHKRYILYRGAKLSLVSGIDKKDTSSEGGAVVRAWLGKEKEEGKVHETSLPLVMEWRDTTPLLRGWVNAKSGMPYWESGLLSYEGRKTTSINRYLDFHFGLNGVRRNRLRGSYKVVHGLMPVYPPGMPSPDSPILSATGLGYFIESEDVSLLKDRSAMVLRQLPNKEVERERVQ